MMQISENGLKFIAAWEKFAPRPYYATQAEKLKGLLTIGYGHVIKPGESFTTLTEAQALDLLKRDCAAACASVNKWAHPSINQCQFDALVDHVINAGDGSIRADDKAGDFDDMVRGGKWATVREHILYFKFQGKDILPGLVRRSTGRQALFDGLSWDAAEKKGRAA